MYMSAYVIRIMRQYMSGAYVIRITRQYMSAYVIRISRQSLCQYMSILPEKVFTIIFPTEQLFRLNKTKLWPANSTKGEHHARMSLVLILAHFMQLMDLAAGALAAGARRQAPRHRGRARSAEASMASAGGCPRPPPPW